MALPFGGIFFNIHIIHEYAEFVKGNAKTRRFWGKPPNALDKIHGLCYNCTTIYTISRTSGDLEVS